jgi:PhzF family phenazine biosynthesis protein
VFTRGRVEIFHTRVFAATPDGGNPCPVVVSANGLAERDMLRLARLFSLDTAFVLSPRTGVADLRVRFFVPDHELEFSGHATIAALTVALHTHAVSGRSWNVETKAGTYPIECYGQGRGMSVEQGSAVFGDTRNGEDVAAALRMQVDELDISRSPIQTVSVSRPKLLIPLRDSHVLNGLVPDYPALWRLCETTQVTGLYPFTRTTVRSVDVEARQFPYRAGFPEDAATGVAAAALAAYLTHYDRRCANGEHVIRIAQGYAMGAPSLIEGIAVCSQQYITKTAVRGSAKIVGHEHIALAE